MDAEEVTATPEKRRAERIGQWIDLLSAMVLATATVATAWCGYQSSQWGGQQIEHRSQATKAVIRTGKLNDIAMQRNAVHVHLFVQWVAAGSTGNTWLADFLFKRFPEPLKSATVAWQATHPLTNPSAPASPFDMPEYALHDRGEADRWEQIASDEAAAADRADRISERYLVFTIIFASVLFFAGISGKFKWQVIDMTMLVLGALTLLIGLVIVFSSPRL